MQNIFAFNVETVKIIDIGKNEGLHKVFIINAGTDRLVKLGDRASFYAKKTKTLKAEQRPIVHFQYQGKAKVVKVFPHTSIWMVDYWPRKKSLKINKEMYFYYLAGHEEMKTQAQTKRNIQVLMNTRSEILEAPPNDERVAFGTTIARLEKSPIKYKDPTGADLNALYVKMIQHGPSREEIIDKLTQKEKANFIQHHLDKMNHQPTGMSSSTELENLRWSDEFSDVNLQRLIARTGEREELQRQDHFKQLWIKTQFHGFYTLSNTNSQNDGVQGSSLTGGMEWPLSYLHLPAYKWSIHGDFRYHSNQYKIYNSIMGSIEEKTLRLGFSYYLWRNPHLLNKFNLNIGLGFRFGGSYVQNQSTPTSNTYSVVSLPSIWTSLKYRIHSNFGFILIAEIDQLSYLIQETTAEYNMPEKFRKTEIQFGGGLCAYF